MAQETKARKELLKNFEIRTMRSDILRFGGATNKPQRKQIKKVEEFIPKPQKPTGGTTEIKKKEETRLDTKRAIERIEFEQRIKEKMKEVEESKKEQEKRQAEEKIEIERKRIEEMKKKEEEMKKMSKEKEKEIEEIKKREEILEREKEEKLQKERQIIQLEEEKLILEKELQKISLNKKPLIEEKELLSRKKEELEKNILEVVEREEKIEREQKNVEKEEKMAEAPSDRKEAEEKRWEWEEKRRIIERERWEWEEELNKIKDQAREINLKEHKIFSQEKFLQEKIKNIVNRQEETQREKEKVLLEKDLQRILIIKEPLEKERNQLLEKEVQLNKKIEEITQKEITIEEEQRNIEKEEKTAGTPEDKKEAERRRWEAEEKRRIIEKERWKNEEELGEINKRLNQVDFNYRKVLREEIEIERKLGRGDVMIEEITTKEKMSEKGQEEKQAGERLQIEIKKKREEIEKRNEKIEMEQKNVEKEEETKEIKREEKLDKIETRTAIERLERQTEKEKTEKEVIRNEKTEIQEAIKRLKKEIEEKRKLEQEREVLRNTEINDIKPIEVEEKPEITPGSIKNFYKEDKEKIDFGNTQHPSQKEESEKEEKEIEIKKRLAEIQEKETSERNEFLRRIQGGRKEEVLKVKNNSPLPTPSPSPPPSIDQPKEILRLVPQKPTTFNKYFSRILASMLILALLGGTFFFIYWYFALRIPPVKMVPCEAEGKEISIDDWTQERCSPTIIIPEIEIPNSLIVIDDIEEFSIKNNYEVKIYLSQILEKDFINNKFIRIIIKNLDEKRVIYLKEFLDLFNLKTPTGFYENLSSEFTLVFYIQEEKIKTAIISKTTGNPEELKNALRYWEDDMEKDFENFLMFFEKEKIITNKNYWSTISYNKIDIRCLTDFSICYAIKNNNFAFSNSLESIKKIIDKL